MTRLAAMLALLAAMSVAGAQSPAVPTLKAKTRIVLIDVVVTDRQGKPVTGLQVADFALAENGAPQAISHFEAHTSLSAEDVSKLAPMPKLDANIFTNYSPAPANAPLTVLLFDALNTHDSLPAAGRASFLKDQSVVRQQILKYLAIPHPGDRMELFELNADLELLQGFTSDPEVLRAALMSKKTEAKVSQMSSMIPNPLCAPDSSEGMAGAGNALGECAAAELQARSLNSLNAMAALARYMGGLPGRKNLLWFSVSFPIPLTDYRVSRKLHETMALFAKNQVAVYPIAAGGLMLSSGGPRAFLNKTDSEVQTMDMMAEDTGGKVFKNTNDIAGAVQQAVDHGSNYYTLTYSPTNKDSKGDFRKVQVKLAQKGYTLDYRKGYYADDDKPKRDMAATDAAPANEALPDPAKIALHAAMEYGSPQPADIVFKAAINPATGHVEDVVARGNSLSPKVPAPFERYVIAVAALPSAFTFTQASNGKRHMGSQMVTCVYSSEGALLNTTAFKVEGDLDDAHYQSIMANGMKFEQQISVPVKGESFLRIGIEDLATSKVGVVEIPVATVAKLKPLGDAK